MTEEEKDAILATEPPEIPGLRFLHFKILPSGEVHLIYVPR